MKTNFFLLFVLFLNSVSAHTYYFSTVSGDDSRTATQARNSSTPWKTLNKLNSFFTSLQPGDSVLLKRGETFYGSIKATRSGTSTSPIVIGAYGSGNNPIITGLVKLGNWVSKSSGIWESYNSSLGATLNIVLLNGIKQGMGRYPNPDEADAGYLAFESHVGTTSITDNELTSAINWTGAELVLRTRRWLLDRNIITAQSGGKLTCVTTGSYEPKDGYGYFIQNSIKTLNKFGEWYYNPSTKKLSVYFGSNTPSSYTVEVSTIESLIYSANNSNIVFTGLTVKGANSLGVDITSGSNISVKNCDIQLSGINGVEVNGQTNFTVDGCTVSNSNNNGIHFGWGVNSAKVRNNKILNTALIAGMGQGGDGNGVGIYDNGDGNVVENNEIRNTCHDGIKFKGNNQIIRNNLIDSFCLTKDDGAGIYAFGRYGFVGSKVIGNIVMNGIGAKPGTGVSTYSTSGIYIDDSNSKIEISGNTFANCHDYGIYIHNSSVLTLKSNTFFNNARRQLTMIQEPDHPSSVRSHVITQNIFFAKDQTELTSYMESNADDISSFGRFDSNYYARPIDDRVTIYNQYPGLKKNLDLDGWKSQYGDDPASKRSAKQVAAFKLNSLIGSNRVANGKFTSSTTGTSSSSASISLGTSGLLDGGYLVVSPTAAKSTVSFKVGNITAGKKYILRYSVIGSANNNLVLTTYLRMDASPYTTVSEKLNRKVSTTRTENEMIFVALASSAGAVQFQTDIQSKYYLDNIEIYEADAKITNPDDSIKFIYNAGTSSKTVTLDGNYMDTKGAKFSNSITLAPYASAVLMKTGGSSTPSNQAPTVSITSPADNAQFNASDNITINAIAADADGSITKVEFFNGSTLLGSDNTSPYSFTWNNVPAGNYSLTAKATDNGSLVTTSNPISISVSNPSAPTVSITNPANNTTFSAPASITINATASDADGSITKVEFYRGSTLLGTDNTSPYSFTWNNVAAGNYTLTAKATDNSSLVTTSAPVNIAVTTGNIPPTISIVAPAADTTSNGPTEIYFKAITSDVDGTVSKVNFYDNGVLFQHEGIAPWEFVRILNVGVHNITATARDNDGDSTTSAVRKITILPANTAPTVSITSPANNATFNAPASITINAIASDADGSITKVEFYRGSTLLGTDNTSPYSFTWNNVAAGNYTLTAKATDNGSMVTTSAAVTISVTSANGAPTVTITSPANNAQFKAPANITLSADASDVGGSISKVQFYNGSTLLRTENLAPYQWVWQNVPAGSYTITAKATDNSSLVTTSTPVNVVVTTGNLLPSISIVKPAADTTSTGATAIYFLANASDPDGKVSKVNFYDNGVLFQHEGIEPWEFVGILDVGVHNITATARDNSGDSTTSAVRKITILPTNTAPTVSITSPSNNATFNAPASITINATASDPDGSITKVEFYRGSTLLGTDYTSPYSLTWNNVPAGNYSITAKATDNNSLVTTSSAITVSVNALPTVNITNPLANAVFGAPASITINATAADADGSVTKVEFYNGNTLLGSDNTSPYSVVWNNVAPGSYTLTAKVTDNALSVVVSSAVNIIVNSLPTVNITSPTNYATFEAPASITINATAADADGSVTKVAFYNGSTLLGTDNTSPYSFTWNNVSTGNYNITAKATDNRSFVTTSSVVVVSVVDPGAPIVRITSPAVNAQFNAPANVTITATATVNIGAMRQVEFYNGTTLLHTVNSAPYTWTWQNVPAGDYVLTAKATSNKGMTTSPAVPISVTTVLAKSVAPPPANNVSDQITLQINPNPASNELSVSVNGVRQNNKLTLSIYSISGALMKTISPKSHGRLIKTNISNFRNGTYIIRAQYGNQLLSKEFIKK